MSGPQLVMRRMRLDDLPVLALPAGYTIRTYRPGDHAAWDRIIGESFELERREGAFERTLRPDPAFRPERIFFACRGDEPVATASAWQVPAFGLDVGYLHYVGTLPAEGGKGLGRQVSLACLFRMAEEGRASAVLQTDDFRLPAIRTYLKLDFIPLLVDDNQRERWREVLRRIDRADLIERFAEALAGPLFELTKPRPNRDSPERYAPRRKWHPAREHRGGTVGGGDLDFLGDESLYQGSRLGTASVAPAEAPAGAPVTEGLTLTYVVGSAGLPEGTSVAFGMRGQAPLGFWPQTRDPDAPAYLFLEGPAHATLEPEGIGFCVKSGALCEGDTVRLRMAPSENLRWNPVAGRREFKVVIRYGRGELEQRLPEPLPLALLPGTARRLEATVPPTRRPGEPLRVHVTARDSLDNRAALDGLLAVRLGEQRVHFPMANGLADGELSAPESGVLRVAVEGNGLAGTSNLSVPSDELQLFIGDLHCHDFLSEAEGYTDEVYRFAIEDRNLDFLSVVPQSHGWHDNETWTIVKYMNERFLREGRFVTFLGFEWQHTGYGDKVIHFLGGDQPYLPVDDGRYNSAAKLYEALRGSDAFVISHHPAYPPGSWCSNTDFDAVAADVERVVELWSMHGSSEGYDAGDRPMREPYGPSLVMEALRRGVRLGFVAGSDSHSARPGGSLKEPLPYWGGLAGVWADRLTRRGLFEAIRARRTVALTRARIVLRMTVNGAWMGSELPPADTAQVRIDVHAPGRIALVELVKNTRCHRRFAGTGDEAHLEVEDATGGPAFYHCRVTLEDGNLAVCSPVWIG